MKKTLSIIAALVLALGMTQCKKAEKPQASTGDPIHVTFTATYGGERTTFTPADGSFVWSTGVKEYIYVGGSTSGYLGTLSATGNGQSTLKFTGDITPSDGETLHFFYLGKGEERSEVTSLDFSTQDGTLQNLTNYHVAVGSQEYTTGMTNFSAYLEPLVAFAYFDLSGFGTEVVSISGDGVYSTATIDYENGTIAGNTKGSISVGAANANEGKKYVALIPSTSVSSTENATTVVFGNTGYTGSLEFKRGVVAGRYYSANGNALEVAATSAAPDYVFSVAADRTVHFSPGNLQYKEGEGWRFALNEWDAIGAWNSSSWVDLFGWGTWSGTSEQWNPLNTSDNNSNYSWKGDEYFKGSIDGHNDWFTLNNTQWSYLFNNRMTSNTVNNVTNARWTQAKINTNGSAVNGVILFPDTFTAGTPTGVTWGTINARSNWTTRCTTDGWSALHDAGCVFLPAAGHRNSIAIYEFSEHGYYSASTTFGYQHFYQYNGEPAEDLYKRNGISVRLVR